WGGRDPCLGATRPASGSSIGQVTTRQVDPARSRVRTCARASSHSSGAYPAVNRAGLSIPWSRGAYLAPPRERLGPGSRLSALARVDDAEAVALRVGEDDVVGVRGPLVPVDLGSSERDQAPDLGGLIVRVEVEVDARRHLYRRAHTVEGDVRPDAVPRTEQGEVVRVTPARHVVQRSRPERLLALEVVDTND